MAPCAAMLSEFLAENGVVGEIGLAVSGGSDSMGMLALAKQENLTCRVATVDHGLRPGAAAEAAHVTKIASTMGYKHDVLVPTKPILVDEGGNLQAEARDRRYALLADWGLAHGLDAVLIAHTLEDQAETFLMRLARGAGVDGLSAMADTFDRNGMRFLRPLLQMRRDALRELLRAQEIYWVEDPSNDDPRFQRITFRNAAPDLAKLGLTPERLSETAQALATAKNALEQATAVAMGDYVTRAGPDYILGSEIFKAPEEIVQRVLKALLGWVGFEPYAPRQSALSALIREMGSDSPTSRTLHSCEIRPVPGGWRISAEAAAMVQQPADQIWRGRWRAINPPAGAEWRAFGPAGQAQHPNWRDGGLSHRSALSSPALWQDHQLISAPFCGFGPRDMIEMVDHPKLMRFIR